MNNVILVGRLTQTPEVKETKSTEVVSITLAVERPFKGQEGEKNVDFIKVVFWDTKATRIGEYCTKGMLVTVRGRLQNRVNEVKVGEGSVNVHMFDVIGESIEFLSTPKPADDVKTIDFE